MSKRPYYTLFVYDRDHKDWFDVLGSYSKAELQDEIEFCGYNKRDCRIVQNDGTVEGPIEAKKSLYPTCGMNDLEHDKFFRLPPPPARWCK